MRFFRNDVMAALSFTVLTLHGQVSTSEPRDFGLGRRIGECLTAKCKVFEGFLLTEFPKPGEPVAVRIDRVLFGKASELGMALLPYEDPDITRTLTQSPQRAWRGVTFSQGAPVTVAIALEPHGDVKASAPFLVVSNERSSAVLRYLAATAVRLELHPNDVSDLVASLSRKPDFGLGGYLYVHLTNSVALRDPELAAPLLAQMIGSSSAPPQVWEEIAANARAEYSRLSTSGRSAMVKRFAELGQHTDVRAAVAAFRSLDRIGSYDNSVWAMVPRDALKGLGNRYRAAVETGKMPRNQSLEKELGVKY
jgi:hypothetical protein